MDCFGPIWFAASLFSIVLWRAWLSNYTASAATPYQFTTMHFAAFKRHQKCTVVSDIKLFLVSFQSNILTVSWSPPLKCSYKKSWTQKRSNKIKQQHTNTTKYSLNDKKVQLFTMDGVKFGQESFYSSQRSLELNYLTVRHWFAPGIDLQHNLNLWPLRDYNKTLYFGNYTFQPFIGTFASVSDSLTPYRNAPV